jgi:hypothetical protein
MKKALLASVFGILLAVGSASAETVVRYGPPAAAHEFVPARPGPRYVWTGGYYRWYHHRYAWVPGRYVVPPRAYAVWVPGYWAPRHGGYVWIQGYWR